MADPEPLCLADFEALARRRLPAPVWDFIAGGSGDEVTLRANVAAFEQLWLRPSVLVDVGCCVTRLELLGASLQVPFGVAPMAFHQLVTPEGELATVRAAGRVGALVVVSVMASRTVEEIAAAATGPLWFQLYWLRDRDRMVQLVGAVEQLGYRALMVTVDMPRMGRRRRDLRNSFVLPEGVTARNLVAASTLGEQVAASSATARHTAAAFDPSVTWDDVTWLRQQTQLPLVLKGILTPEDARRAVDHGVDGVVVSNHGGRQLDGVPPALTMLGDVVAAVDRDIPVLVDGGVRRGVDVVKALALGAHAVLVGRPVLWGLAASGEQGAAAVLTLLRDELDDAMALAGRPTLDQLDESLLFGSPVTGPEAAPLR